MNAQIIATLLFGMLMGGIVAIALFPEAFVRRFCSKEIKALIEYYRVVE